MSSEDLCKILHSCQLQNEDKISDSRSRRQGQNCCARVRRIKTDSKDLITQLLDICRGNLWKPLGIAGVVLLMSLFAGIGVGVYVGLQPHLILDPPNPTEPIPPSDSPLGVYYDGAVAANCYPCNLVGRYNISINC